MKKTLSVITAVAITAGLTVQPVSAQSGYGNQAGRYEDGYRAGYRAGYDTARHRGRYNDQPPQAGYYNGPPPQPGYDNSDPNQRWRQRYSRSYTYNDDSYYRECRNQPDPGGVLAGALIGGLLGNAAGRGGGRGGATVAGVIIGGALGAGLTNHLQCEDRSYAYQTYYNGFNSGRPHSDWQWENPNSGNYGDFRLGDYYNDQDGFRCATFTQQVWVNDRPEIANGHACQQPDGTWTIVN